MDRQTQSRAYPCSAAGQTDRQRAGLTPPAGGCRTHIQHVMISWSPQPHNKFLVAFGLFQAHWQSSKFSKELGRKGFPLEGEGRRAVEQRGFNASAFVPQRAWGLEGRNVRIRGLEETDFHR